MKRISLYLYIAALVATLTACGVQTEQAVMEETGMNQETEAEQEVEINQEIEAEQETISLEQSEMYEETTEENPQPTESSAIPGSSISGALHLEGTQLTDSNGNPIQLRGVSTHGLSWFPQYVNEEFFKELHDRWNANVVRLAMYTAEYNGYCSGGNQEELKQLIRDGVQYATDADLYVIIDWHILSDGNPHQNKEAAKDFFAEMSKEFSSHENVLYEICNEPNGGVQWADIKSYAEEVIPVIRENDEDAIIIVGTPTWSQDVDQAAADPIQGYDNIMYALHFYAATHTDWLRDRMVNAIDAGLPIFVTEFGTCDASGNGGIDAEQSEQWIETMDEKGVSYVAWNLSNKAETSAVFKAECQKTAGFTAEDLSDNGQWIYEMLTRPISGN